MAEDYVCSVCGARESFVGNKVKIFKVADAFYCEEHLPGKDGQAVSGAKATVPVSQATQEQKLTKLTEMAIRLESGQQEQITLLRSIKSSLTFFVVIVIIAIVVQILPSCVN